MTVKYFCHINLGHSIARTYLMRSILRKTWSIYALPDSLYDDDENKTVRIDSSIGSELMLVKVHPRLHAVPFGISIAVESRNRDFQCALHSDKLDSGILRDAQTPFDL